MKKNVQLTLLGILLTGIATAQDTIIQAKPEYNTVGRGHRKIFGENYRKEWAAPTQVPVIKISEKGLTPSELGGGKQTKSLRLKDAQGREWTLRSIEKNPVVLLPEPLRQTFAADWLQDAMSSEHPYAALMVPVLATALNVPHSTPIIGWVAPDPAFGKYEKTFANTLCLLEEREPLGESDNTEKMKEELDEDNDNTVDTFTLFRARMLDFFLGDWDRHHDQWRWVDQQEGKGKKYVAVPRDRDQAFFHNHGIIPDIASRKWIAPFLTGFDGRIRRGNHFFTYGGDLDARFFSQLTYDQWMEQTKAVTAMLTDSVLEAALSKLPESAYRIRHDEFLKKMKERRGNMVKAMEDYYHFFNRIIELQTSDKNELVEVTDGANGGLQVTIHKINKEGEIKDLLFSRTLEPKTKELRLFIHSGHDSVVLNTTNSDTKIRVIGGDDRQVYNVVQAGKKVNVYEKKQSADFIGKTDRLRKIISNDSLNTAYERVNLYDVTIPLITAGFNIDDGVLLGPGFRYVRRGFHKQPYASMQQMTAAYSFSTGALRVRYRGEWIRALGKADITLQAAVFAPNNTMNFFGRGNETEYIRFDERKTRIKFYRIRYNMYQVNPSLRWNLDSGTSISVGPSLWYYSYNPEDNEGRFINNTHLIRSYDSLTIGENKLHGGVILNFINDKRDRPMLTTRGSFINIRVQGYKGLNDFSESFMQIIPEFALYKNLNKRSTVVIADRVGGMISVGKTAFYQSAFLGGQENLLGYRQFRFAGEHSLYNNLELRMHLAKVASYILPGYLGVTGFYDVGRVWIKDESSKVWHHGVGGGFYFTPAQMALFQLVMGYSNEGWYPYITMNFRF
jgi:hypothetical protein